MPRFHRAGLLPAVTVAAGLLLASPALLASSHREAPFITEKPKVDGTDFYMFRSYETGREDFVTIIANYIPLQDAYGGPNYFTMDTDALYEIHIDNDGDAVEDITFQFTFENEFRNASLPIGPGNSPVTIPLTNVGLSGNASDVGPGINDNAGLNVVENYRIRRVNEGRRQGNGVPVINMSSVQPDNSDNMLFRKPVDNIGNKTISAYETYANNHVFDVQIPGPGCSTGEGPSARVFVGQRREGFVVNLGEVFDRINLNPLGDRNLPGANIVDDKNITSIALEVPRACLTAQGSNADPVIGAWTTASVRQGSLVNPQPQGPQSRRAGQGGSTGPTVEGGAWAQVSRLGSPLVNEVVIGLDAKDRFNASSPSNDLDADTGFGVFVLYPTLPVLVDALFPVVDVPTTPRNDLVAAFVTGIRTPVNGTPTNFTQPQAISDGGGAPGEMLRMNTAFPGGPAPQLAAQDDLGFLACDLYGFPNGRRPVDDVVDIELSVAMGALTGDNDIRSCDVSGPTPTPTGSNVVTDGARADATPGVFYLNEFPYLATPIAGSPNSDIR